MQEKINVSIEEGIVKEVDRWAREFDLSRSRMVQNLLAAALVDVELLKTIGLIDLGKFVGKVQKRWKDKMVVG